MEEFDELVRQFQPQSELVLNQFKEFVFANFEAFDTDRDGFLSKDELHQAVRQEGRTLREAGFINFLLVRMQEIADAFDEQNDGKKDCISRMDLQAYFAKLV